jgi:Acetyltransferase (GNAT) domain
MTELLVLSNLNELTKVAESWDRLRKGLPHFFPDFESARFFLSDVNRNFGVFVRLYIHRATNGRLRCYIVYASGTPCAYLRGEFIDDTYYYETPGFDPQYSKLSPGLVLLVWAIRDLIEQTSCKNFDFGHGGDTWGYKSKFGNTSYDYPVRSSWGGGVNRIQS